MCLAFTIDGKPIFLMEEKVMKKKFIKISAILVALLFVFTACGKSDSSSKAKSSSKSDSNELVVWGWDKTMNGYALDQAKKVYNDETGKNIKIKFVEMAKPDTLKKLHTILASGVDKDVPDIVLISDLNAQGYLMSYPDAFKSMDDVINYKDFAPYKKDSVSYDGKGYGVPFDTGVAGLFYRRDYLEEVGYTEEKMQNLTWDEYLSLGEKLKAKGHMLQPFNPNDISQFQILLQSTGKWFTNEKGKADFTDNEALKEAYGIFKKLNDSHFVEVSSDWTKFAGSITNGDVACVMRGSWLSPTILDAKDQSGKWGVAPIPKLNAEGATNRSNQGGSSWFVLNDGSNSKLATDFMKKTFAGSTELYDTLLKEKNIIGTYLPASDSKAYDEPQEFYGGQKLNRDFSNWLSEVPEVDTGAYSTEAQAALLAVTPNILKGEDLDKCLKEAEEQFNQSIQ